MRVGLVNLCKLDSYAKEGFSFLEQNNISFIDYASGRETLESQLEGFNAAISDKDVDIVWFVQGGSTLIKYLDKIDWTKVSNSGKQFWGLSDFTHFAVKAVPLGVKCFYGQGLKYVDNFFQTQEQKRFLVDFINGSSSPVLPESHKAIGGLVNIVTFMLQRYQVDLSGYQLFLEYHGAEGEKWGEVEYYFDQLKAVIKDNRPQGFLLGHSMLTNDLGQVENWQILNQKISKLLEEYNLPISSVDHFNNVIGLG